jgi:hypothetical protein
VVVKACTGRLFVANVVAAPGAVAHIAESTFGPGRARGRQRLRVNDLVLTLVLAYRTRTGTPGSPRAPTLRTIQLIALFDRRMQP